MSISDLPKFIEQAPVAAAMFDKEMHYIAVSERWLTERGLDRSIIGRTAYEIYPDVDQKFRRFHQRALAGEILGQTEDRLETPHGTVEWLRWEMRPWTHINGEVGGIVVFAENITDRKKAELALHEMTKRFNLVQSAAEIAVWDWDIATNKAWVNGEYYKALGFSDGVPLTYEDFLERIHPEDRQAYEEMVRLAFSNGGTIDGECRIIRKDNGEVRNVKSKGVVFFDTEKRATRAMGAMWDISALRKAEQDSLERAHESYKLLIRSAQEGVWLIDANGFTTLINDRMAKLLGYNAEELIGQKITEFMDFESQHVAEDNLNNRATGPIENHDFKFIRKDGSDLWALLSFTPILENNAYQGALVMAIDYTERKTLLEERQQYIEELKNVDLGRDQFLAKLAHELMTPLSSISLAASMIKMEMKNPEKTENLFQKITNQIEYLSRIIDDLLQASAIKSGKVILKKDVIDIGDLLSRTSDTYFEIFKKKNITLKVSLFESELKVIGDKTRLTQVFGNLLHNAAKYTQANGFVHLTLFRQGHDAVVTVHDNGSGIPPERIPWIFEIFNKIENGPESARDGFGIGLALVKELVELHQGSVEARSDGPGKGSEFIVRLPLINSSADALSATSQECQDRSV